MSNRFDELSGHRYAPGFVRLEEAPQTPWHEPLLRIFEAYNNPMTIGTLLLSLACGLLVIYGNHHRRARRRAERLARLQARLKAEAALPTRQSSGFGVRLTPVAGRKRQRRVSIWGGF